jgi:hypothetical protein
MTAGGGAGKGAWVVSSVQLLPLVASNNSWLSNRTNTSWQPFAIGTRCSTLIRFPVPPARPKRFNS